LQLNKINWLKTNVQRLIINYVMTKLNNKSDEWINHMSYVNITDIFIESFEEEKNRTHIIIREYIRN